MTLRELDLEQRGTRFGIWPFTIRLINLCSSLPCSYINGSRVLDTHLYQPEAYPFGLIAPVTIIWRPVQDSSMASTLVGSSSNKSRSKKKSKVNRNPKHPARHVWIKCHPLCFEEVRGALQSSTSSVLAPPHGKVREAIKAGDYSEVMISDLRDQFIIFELFGPKCCQVLSGALRPASGEYKEVGFHTL